MTFITILVFWSLKWWRIFLYIDCKHFECDSCEKIIKSSLFTCDHGDDTYDLCIDCVELAIEYNKSKQSKKKKKKLNFVGSKKYTINTSNDLSCSLSSTESLELNTVFTINSDKNEMNNKRSPNERYHYKYKLSKKINNLRTKSRSKSRSRSYN